MRKAIGFTLLFLTLTTLALGQETIKSTIKTAQVYTQGAQIERIAKAELKPGKNELKLSGLSSTLAPNTIQIGGSGFTILSVRHETDFINNDNQPARFKALETQKVSLSDSLKLIELEHSIIQKQMDLLEKNMSIVGDEGINNEDFQSAINFFNQKFEVLTRNSFQLQRERVDLEARLKLVEEQIRSENSVEKKPSSNIYLVLDSKSAQSVDLNISYAITEAGWFPAYDIRATDTKSPLALTYKARVFQNSGIDWKNVKLKISSGNLEGSGTAPELQALLLGGHNNRKPDQGPITSVSGVVTGADDGLPLPQVSVFLKGTTLGVPTDENGRYTLQVPSYGGTLVFRYLGYVTQEIPIESPFINVSLAPDAAILDEVVVTAQGVAGQLQGRVAGVNVSNGQNVQIRGLSSTYTEHLQKPFALDHEQINYQTSFVYDIDLPYDIPSTGKPEIVNIKTVQVPARYKYMAAPKANEKAYLTAQISDWTKLNLLDGTSNLYFKNSFVGQSIIDTRLGNDTLKVSMGKDEGIIVNRQRKKDFEQKRFFTNKKREERHFEITVVNTKEEEISMVVYDQIPVAVRSNIKVNTMKLTGGNLDKQTGIVSWQLKLNPGEKKVLKLKYSVDYPKYQNYNIN